MIYKVEYYIWLKVFSAYQSLYHKNSPPACEGFTGSRRLIYISTELEKNSFVSTDWNKNHYVSTDLTQTSYVSTDSTQTDYVSTDLIKGKFCSLPSDEIV